MDQDTHSQSVLFPEIADRDVVVVADDPAMSSDAGAVLIRTADKRLGMIGAFTECIPDLRMQAMVEHTMEEMLRQRIFGIVCGYEDANDAARLKHDPVLATVVRGDPADDTALASQPTLSRFENTVDGETNNKLALAFMQRVLARQCARLSGRARRIMVDFDSTVDPTHGAQQLSLFNGFYNTWCYQTLLGFVRFDDEREQHLASASRMPGTGSAVAPTIEELFWLVALLRTQFRNARLCVRLDAGFASPDMFGALDRREVDYVVGMPENAVLKRLAEPYMIRARALAKETGESARVYGEEMYQAGTWPAPQRVIIKAEVVAHEDREHRDNARFVITNLRQSPHHIYAKVYSQRGDIENRIKELKHDLCIDRTSCTKFDANRFRVIMTAAAYAMLQEIRRAARGTTLATAQVGRLRLSIIKVAARVVATARRIVMHLPESFAYLHEWRIIARRLGAAYG
jgi:hypothetical protein